ncbi:zinc-binding dehydrogenase [Streptosporangium sp. KLBMP 9127]|nr:zinc-binding dehydrogenase [Streptosporangium sp. KLBMP 9127]
MRALVTASENSAWVLADRPEPACGPADVLVEVRAAGLNRGDLLMRAGKYLPTSASWNVPFDRVGFDMAGTVRAVGPEVHGVEGGQAVMAMAGGACADLLAVDHRILLPVPAGLGWARAAALPSALATEYDALAIRGRMRVGDVVFVTGGTTGAGLVGVQLARALGASLVLATTRSAGKAAQLRELGVDRVIDTSAESPSDAVNDATGGHGFDVMLDHLGGSVLERSLAAAASGARIVQIGRLGGGSTTVDLDILASRRLELIGTTFRGRRMDELARLTAELREKVLPLVTEGAVRPIVETVFPLSRAEEAATRLSTQSTTGKIILTGFGRAGTDRHVEATDQGRGFNEPHQ